jgi:hypothetical protein
MTMRDRIDGVLIDPDENGFHLLLSGEERDYNFLLDQKAAEELHAAVATEISHWLVEKRMALTQLAQAVLMNEDLTEPLAKAEALDSPYDQNDPKHPEYHDTMSGIWDNRADK